VGASSIKYKTSSLTYNNPVLEGALLGSVFPDQSFNTTVDDLIWFWALNESNCFILFVCPKLFLTLSISLSTLLNESPTLTPCHSPLAFIISILSLPTTLNVKSPSSPNEEGGIPLPIVGLFDLLYLLAFIWPLVVGITLFF